jgi:hypothetical protein
VQALVSICSPGETVLAIRDYTKRWVPDAFALWAIGGECSKLLGYLPVQRAGLGDGVAGAEELQQPRGHAMCAGRIHSKTKRALVQSVVYGSEELLGWLSHA